MKVMLWLSPLLLTGCMVSAPVKHALPDMPALLTERCVELKLLNEKEEKLSELLKTVAHNYMMYHECATKHDLIIKWYKEQKQIHDVIHDKK